MTRIVVVTGASGAGKTTLVRALEARNLPGIQCHYFDSAGVPPPEVMTAEFGSPENWQAATTHRWIAELAKQGGPDGVAVLEGQVRPSVVRAAFARYGVARGGVVLIDCSQEIRDARLRDERRQPGLASPQMAAWAAYLRGQADALDLPVLDTTHLSVADALQDLIVLVQAWATV